MGGKHKKHKKHKKHPRAQNVCMHSWLSGGVGSTQQQQPKTGPKLSPPRATAIPYCYPPEEVNKKVPKPDDREPWEDPPVAVDLGKKKAIPKLPRTGVETG